MFLFGNVFYGASIVIYNSFLPEIAAPRDRDRVSSRGWAIGYVAGCLMLVLHLGLVLRGEALGISQSMAIRISLCSTGVWWALFTIPTLRVLKNRGTPRPLPEGSTIWTVGFGQLIRTIGHMRHFPETGRFLIAYLLYNDAIQTVLVVSTQFGGEELGIPIAELTLTILIAQFVGVFGALGFQKLAARVGAKHAIIVALVVWTFLLIYAYGFVETVWQFYAMAAGAGAVMGGSQALSRSLFAQLVPRGKEAEYFSIYEIGDKGTSWMGPPVFGLALQFTGSYRIAILSLIIFFAAGLAVLWPLQVEKGRERVIADSLAEVA